MDVFRLLDHILPFCGRFILTLTGLKEYAQPLIRTLDPDGTIFSHCLFRSNCVPWRGHFLKDLRKLNRDLSRTVLVDNNAFCFLPQLGNGIPISSFFDNEHDLALNVLNQFLSSIELDANVTHKLVSAFNLDFHLGQHRQSLFAYQ